MKPILFNTEMVRAFLAGQKTQTRRIVRPRHGGHLELHDDVGGVTRLCERDGTLCRGLKPPYEPGDVLYVRETWTKLYYVDPDGYTHFDQPMYYYAADGTPDITLRDADGFELEDQRIRWRPSIHMPKEAARIFLRVTDVRVERLHKMTDDDVRREGIENPGDFIRLWDSTIRPADRDRYGWAANPWVWVICFERISKEAADE